MKNSMNHRSFIRLAGLVVTALLVGCHHDMPPKQHGEAFYKDGAPTSVGQFTQAQSAAGAKEDGTLCESNFDGANLNSLGEGKLDLMVKGGNPGETMFVYLSMPHDLVAARQASVTAYLKNAGVTETGIIVAEGANPNLNTPTAYNIGGIYKTDGTTFNGQATVDSGGAGGLAGAAGH